MLGGELSLHLLNVLLLTLGIASLVLWRYRRAVLAGMRGRSAETLQVAPARNLPVTQRGVTAGTAPDALRWEAQLRRRVFVAVLFTTLLCALPVSLLTSCSYSGELQLVKSSCPNENAARSELPPLGPPPVHSG